MVNITIQVTSREIGNGGKCWGIKRIRKRKMIRIRKRIRKRISKR